MERTRWTDERIDDAFESLRGEMGELRAEMRTGFERLHADIRVLWVVLIGSYVSILVAIVAQG
jgi:hypothetical protein